MQRWIERFTLVSLGILAMVGRVDAAAVTYFGTTDGGLLWNRPNAGIPPVPPVSGIGTAVPLSVDEFTVSQSGAYDFLSDAITPTDWDNNLYLYQSSFDPLMPLSNILAGNDDFPDVGLSGFSGVNLTVGTNYFLVTTGFNNASSGSYSNSVSGPGDVVFVTPVPEPASLVMCGFSACLMLVRRNRNPSSLLSANS